jgi:hypothetical protein
LRAGAGLTMPFTPFHLGAGAVFKAIGGPRFSFMVFGGAQVLMDIEPGVRIYLGTPLLHGMSHTLAGALAIGTVAGVIGLPVSRFVLERLHIRHAPFTWTASFLGAYLGTLSHVALDAFMHPDMQPAWPFSAANPLLGAIPVDWLHVLCVLGAVAGGLGTAVRLRPQP